MTMKVLRRWGDAYRRAIAAKHGGAGHSARQTITLPICISERTIWRVRTEFAEDPPSHVVTAFGRLDTKLLSWKNNGKAKKRDSLRSPPNMTRIIKDWPAETLERVGFLKFHEDIMSDFQADFLVIQAVGLTLGTGDSATVRLEDGSSLTGDIIIGADGRNSFVRSIVAEGEVQTTHTITGINISIPIKAVVEDDDLKTLFDQSEFAIWMGSESSVFGVMDEGLIGLAGSAVLVGDAAHSILIHGSHNSAMAIEDAATLGRLFSRLSNRDQIPRLLDTYQSLRTPRLRAIHDSEYQAFTQTCYLPDPLQEGRDSILRATLSDSHGAVEAEMLESIWEEYVQLFSYNAEEQVENQWAQWPTHLGVERSVAVQIASWSVTSGSSVHFKCPPNLMERKKTTVPVSEIEAPFFEHDVYDDCDIPLDIVSGLLAAGSSSVTAGFAVSENGGLARSGDAEKSDAEEEAVPSLAPLGRAQRKRIGTSRYRGPFGRSTKSFFGPF
ncbi:hypothetical protein K438DRAFT_1927146 [Mycena galopus ATCC 62051]|nr:hypothetical protein K438DRAFT_1927146 [Mycena galopus ATCC 62051]